MSITDRELLELAAKFIELWHLRGIEVSSEVLEIARDIRALEVRHHE